MNEVAGAELFRELAGKFSSIAEIKNSFVTTVLVGKDELIDLLEMLKREYGFNYLADIMAVDNKVNLTVTYRVHSMPDNRQLAIKVNIDSEALSLPTVRSIWRAADWQEREIYDLMGIHFSGRSNDRILLPEDFEGHPLRKDYKRGAQV